MLDTSTQTIDLSDHVSVRALDTSMGYHTDLGPGPFRKDTQLLLGSPQFENLINERLIGLETNFGRLREARQHAALISQLLTVEPDRTH